MTVPVVFLSPGAQGNLNFTMGGTSPCKYYRAIKELAYTEAIRKQKFLSCQVTDAKWGVVIVNYRSPKMWMDLR